MGEGADGGFEWLDGCLDLDVSVGAPREVSAIGPDGTFEAVVGVAVEVVATAAGVGGALDGIAAELVVTTEALAGTARMLDGIGAATDVVGFGTSVVVVDGGRGLGCSVGVEG